MSQNSGVDKKERRQDPEESYPASRNPRVPMTIRTCPARVLKEREETNEVALFCCLLSLSFLSRLPSAETRQRRLGKRPRDDWAIHTDGARGKAPGQERRSTGLEI